MSDRLNIGMIFGNVRNFFTTFLRLTDTPSTYLGQAGKMVIVATGENGLTFADVPTGAGANTDEQIKYDAFDPTAGYLIDKIIAGDNITLSEGTGANENKMVVSSSGGGGTGGVEPPELHLDFEESGDEFIYNVPYDMKFTSMVYEIATAVLGTPLNTDLSRYDKLTITASATGLVSLYGEYI